ncbi:MAG: type IV toxin-antitoxin system AbiEi family antitoxin [Pricia sp.]
MNITNMYLKNDVIYEATFKLEQLINVPIEINSREEDHDALLTIKGQQFIVEAKSAIRTSNQGLILSQLQQLKQQSDRPIIVIADFISKNATEALKGIGINYIDTAGNAFIKHKDLVFLIEGQKKVNKEKTNQPRAFQEAGIKILFHLLSNPEHLQDTYRTIADKADVSLGSVSHVMAELEHLNFLLKTKDKRILKNKKELLERWIVEYNTILRPRIVRKRMRFVIADDVRNWRNINTHNNNGVIFWGGEPGGALLTNNLRPEKFTVFTNLELAEVSKALRLVPDQKGEVEVLQKFWNSDFENTDIAPTLLVYADLINSGLGRNIETAKQIQEHELSYIQ